jgi:hypothetical protein
MASSKPLDPTLYHNPNQSGQVTQPMMIKIRIKFMKKTACLAAWR